MTSRFTIAKEKVLDDLEGVVADLYQASRKHLRGGVWNVRNPFRPGAKESQMVVWIKGNRRGAFKDYVSEDKGDAIDLVAFGLEGVVSHASRMRALEWVEGRYGIKDLNPETRRVMESEAKIRKVAAEAKEVERRTDVVARARKMFFAAEEGINGTVAEAYLNSRGLFLEQLPQLVANSFRFSPRHEHWLSAPRDGEGKKTGKGNFYPALISAMVSPAGKLEACHITYLAGDGSGKAPEDKAKLMWPETSGLVIRVTQGETGLTLDAAAAEGKASILGVTEGIEDAMSAGQTNPELRMWAAGSLSGLLGVPDHAAISAYLIFKDNDWGKPQATALFNRAVARIRAFRKPVEVVAMPAEWGKDLNDALRR